MVRRGSGALAGVAIRSESNLGGRTRVHGRRPGRRANGLPAAASSAAAALAATAGTSLGSSAAPSFWSSGPPSPSGPSSDPSGLPSGCPGPFRLLSPAARRRGSPRHEAEEVERGSQDASIDDRGGSEDPKRAEVKHESSKLLLEADGPCLEPKRLVGQAVVRGLEVDEGKMGEGLRAHLEDGPGLVLRDAFRGLEEGGGGVSVRCGFGQ